MGDLQGRAGVEIDVKGADRAAAAARSALSPWGEYADKAKTKFGEFRREVGTSIGGVVSDLGRVITVGSSISFAGAVQGVQSFEKATAQLAVSTGRDAAFIRGEFESIGEKMGMKPEAVASYVTGVGRITYSFSDAQKNLAAFKNAATDWNRPLESMAGLQVAINKLGFKDAEKALAQIRANAESLKTTGGPAALADQVERLAGVWDKVRGGGGKGAIALTGEVDKNLSPAQAQAAQQQILGEFTGDTVGWERFLRRTGQLGKNERVTDDQGQIKNLPDYIARIQKGYLKTSGGSKEQMQWLAGLHFGNTISGAAFANMDPEALARLANEQKSSDAQKRMNATDAGRRDIADAKMDKNMRGAVGSDSFLGGLNMMFKEFAGDHPLAAKGGELGVAGTAGWLGRSLIPRLIGGAAASGGGGAAAGGGTSMLGAFGNALFGTGASGFAAAGAGAAGIAGSLLALGGATAPLNRNMRQIEGEQAAAFQEQREGRLRAIVRAAERSGLTPDQRKYLDPQYHESAVQMNYARELGKPLLAQIANDPSLQVAASGLAEGRVDLSQLGGGLAAAFKDALDKSPLKVHVEIVDSTAAGVEVAQQDFSAANGSGNQ